MNLQHDESNFSIIYNKKRLRGWCHDPTSLRRTNFFSRQEKLQRLLLDHTKKNVFATLIARQVQGTSLCEIAKVKTAKFPRSKNHNATKKNNKDVSSGYCLARQLIIPDFLIDIPANLGKEWLAYKRPEGARVILASCYGLTYAFNKNGKSLGSFPTVLPREGCTVLDTVLCLNSASCQPLETNSGWNSNILQWTATKNQMCFPEICVESSSQECSVNIPEHAWFVVVDAMSWGECSLTDLPYDCRRFLLQSKFESLQDQLWTKSRLNRFPICLIPIVEATVENLDDLYFSRNHVLHNIRSDSIMFVHKEALYLPGLSQLYLCWRDKGLSRYYVDTVDGVNISLKQVANVWLRFEDGFIFTEDKIRIAQMSKELIPQCLNSLKDTVYLRRWRQGFLTKKILVRIQFSELNLKTFSGVTSEETDVSDSSWCTPETGNLIDQFEIIETASPARRTAESLNRILHQFIMRQSHQRMTSFNKTSFSLSFDDIKRSAKLGIPNYTMMLLKGNRHLEEFYEPSEENELTSPSDISDALELDECLDR